MSSPEDKCSFRWEPLPKIKSARSRRGKRVFVENRQIHSPYKDVGIKGCVLCGLYILYMPCNQ